MKSFLDAETNSGELLPEETIEQIIHETNPLLDSKVSLKLRWSMSNFAVSQIQSDSPLVLEWITRLWNTEESVKQRMHIFSADLLVNRFLNLHHNRKHGAEKMLKKIGELIHMIFDLLGAEVGDSFCTHFSEKLIEDCNADGTSVNRLISMLFHLLGDPRYPALLAITVSIFTWTQGSLKLNPKLAAKGVHVLGALSSDPRGVATTSSSSSSSFIGRRTMIPKEREKVAERCQRKGNSKQGGKNKNVIFNGEQGWDLWNGPPGSENATTGAARRFLELKFKCPMELKNASSCEEEHDACMDVGAQDENCYPRNEQNDDSRERKVKRTKLSDPYVDYDREMQRLLHALAFASAQRLVTVFHHSKDLNPKCHHALHEHALRMWPVAHFAVPAQEGLKDANYRLRVLTLQKVSQWYELRTSGLSVVSTGTGTGTGTDHVGGVSVAHNNTPPHLTAKLIHTIAACSTHAHPHVRKQVALFFTTHLSSMSPNLTWEHWVQFTLMFNSTSFPSSYSGEKWEQAEGHPVLMDALARLPGSELVHFLNAHPEPRPVVTRIVRAWARQAPFFGGEGSKGTKHSTDDEGTPYNTLSMVTQKLAHHFFASRTHEAATAFDRLMDAVLENNGGDVDSDSDSDSKKSQHQWLPQAGEGFMTQLFSLTFNKELNEPTRYTILTVLRKLFHIGVKLPDSFLCSGLIHDLCNETQTSGDLKMVCCIIQLLHALNDNRVTDAGTAEAYAVDLCVKTQDYLKKLKNAHASNSCDEIRENKNYLKAGDAVLTRLYAMTCFVEACSADLELSVHTFNMLSMLYRENEDLDVRRSIIEAQTPLYRYLSAKAGLTEEIFLKFVTNELTWAFENDLNVGLESALLLVEDAVKRGDGAKMEILSRLAALANARFSKEPRAVVSFLGVFLERGIIFPSDFMLDGKLIAMIMGDTTHADIALQYLKHMEPRHVAHGFLVGVEAKTRDALRAAMGPSFFNTKAGNEGDRVGNIIELLNHFDIKGRSIIGHAMLRCLELGPAEYNFFSILAKAMADVAAWNGKLLEDWCNGLTSIQPQTTESRILQATSFWMCQTRTKRGLLQNAIQAATNVDTPEAIWHWWSDMRGQVVDEFETSTTTLPLGKRRRLSRLNCNSSSIGVPSLRSRSEPCFSHSKELHERTGDIDMW